MINPEQKKEKIRPAGRINMFAHKIFKPSGILFHTYIQVGYLASTFSLLAGISAISLFP